MQLTLKLTTWADTVVHIPSTKELPGPCEELKSRIGLLKRFCHLVVKWSILIKPLKSYDN